MGKITKRQLRHLGFTKKQRLIAEQMLFDPPSRTHKFGKVYNPYFHPQDILQYFKERLESLPEIERIKTERGDVKYIQKPVRLPTLSGYAVQLGVTRETLWSWSQEHTDFGEAYGQAKACQEELLIQAGAVGGYDKSLAIFILKNLQGWQDRVEQTHRGGVTLQFDAEDENA